MSHHIQLSEQEMVVSQVPHRNQLNEIHIKLSDIINTKLRQILQIS